ncbi:MAG TPA: alpha-ketoglutarate-dependent dioxygenase AlkB [Aliidongia sp.]|nr:alpha-ketoglutarate-dependent dioxygenase AlkB [Aliidongia sp.]
MTMLDLPVPPILKLGEGIALLPGRAGDAVLEAVQAVMAAAPPRHLTTPWGKTMSVAMTNCGPLGWVADREGYRYSPTDPLSGLPWPAMPAPLRDLAAESALAAGFPGFAPEGCLVNRYGPEARMGLHQDRDERDLGQPIVSVSLGMSARFRIGGPKPPIRRGRSRSIMATCWCSAGRRG